MPCTALIKSRDCPCHFCRVERELNVTLEDHWTNKLTYPRLLFRVSMKIPFREDIVIGEVDVLSPENLYKVVQKLLEKASL